MTRSNEQPPDTDDNERGAAVNITEPVLLIRIPRLYRSGMSARALYDATRRVWRIGKRREGARFALAVRDGIVREVYEVLEWLPAGSTEYESRAPTSHPGRWEFVGKVADESLRAQYVGESVAHYFRPGVSGASALRQRAWNY